MNAQSFSIFKRADRSCYSVAFKDANGKYLRPVSTGKKTEKEAVAAAHKMLYEGIPQKKKVARTAARSVTVGELSLKDMVRKIKTADEAQTVLAELQRLGWVKSFVVKDTAQSENFIAFLNTFWDWEQSLFVKEKLRKNHSIHKRYCKGQGQAVAKYWEPFFKGRFLGDITAKDLDAFIAHIGEKGLSASRKNIIVKAGTKPLRWAFSKSCIDKEPTRGHIMFSVNPQKRNILTPITAAATFRTVWKDERAKLANMLASVTGMRSGEIAALRSQDLEQDCIYVRSSWNYIDGIKPPKNNETRTAEIPFPGLMDNLWEQARKNPWGVSPDSFVFWSETKKDVPMNSRLFVDGLREALKNIGFTESEAANYMFHGWRHFFTSYMVKKLDRKLLKSQTGHLTDDMIDLYSDHETVGDKEIIQNTKRIIFAGLLPEKMLLLEYKGDEKTAAA